MQDIASVGAVIVGMVVWLYVRGGARVTVPAVSNIPLSRWLVG